MQSKQDNKDLSDTENQRWRNKAGETDRRSSFDHPRRIACCGDPAATSRGGNNYCASCGSRTNYRLRQAMFNCSHEGGKSSFADSPEQGCLTCGMRFCITDDCGRFACNGDDAGHVLYCGAHASDAS